MFFLSDAVQSIRICITNQNAKHFDLRGETYGAIVSALLAKCFNRGICLDEGEPEK